MATINNNQLKCSNRHTSREQILTGFKGGASERKVYPDYFFLLFIKMSEVVCVR